MSSRETSDRMSSSRVGSCWPQASSDAGWMRSWNSGETGVKKGVPEGKTEGAEAEEVADAVNVGDASMMGWGAAAGEGAGAVEEMSSSVRERRRRRDGRQ